MLGLSRVLGETGLTMTNKHKSEEESTGRCLDSVRGREWRGGEGFVPCVWVLKESDGRKEEKGEKGVYGEREDTRGYGNCEPNIVLK